MSLEVTRQGPVLVFVFFFRLLTQTQSYCEEDVQWSLVHHGKSTAQGNTDILQGKHKQNVIIW